MNGIHCGRALGAAMILGSAISISARAQMATTPSTNPEPAGAVGWLYAPPGCALGSDVVSTGDRDALRVVSCGATGSFAFGKPDLGYKGGCRSITRAVETPAAIPVERTPDYPADFPCSRESCFTRQADSPWVAVVDWPSDHGRSVAATIREASDQQVETVLYDLTGGGALSALSPSVSDLQVLAQLCALADDVEMRPDDRPVAVNLSFGRMVTPADCIQPDGPDGAPSTLGCAVGRVLADLSGAGVVPVAAAGNHQEMLFPAASPGVLSAGALDLSWLEHNGDVQPSIQTPGQARALMLGYGLYLSADGNPPYWPAPPGSSYAAALLSGWLGGTVAKGGKLPDPATMAAARWAPALPAGPDGLALAFNGEPLPGSPLNGPRALLDRAREVFLPLPGPRTGYTLTLLAGPSPTLPSLSLLHADAGNGPQPGIDPCVPCGNGRPVGAGEQEQGHGVTVDLSSSGGLPDGMALKAVYLRAGWTVHRLDGSQDPALLLPLAAGGLGSLTFSGIDGLLQYGEQLSLVLVVKVGEQAYWHEVPINLPAPQP